jgi:hypothetical protein
VAAAVAAAMLLGRPAASVEEKTAPAVPQDSPPVYGCPWNADSLGNFEIGRQAGRTASYRFRAAHSGTVDRVMIYLIFRAPGYYKGDGGQILLQFHTDDGNADHNPSGTVLASSLVTDPMKQWNRLFVFDKPVPLEAGKLYHLVFTNPAPDPVNNFVSVDALHHVRRKPGVQPAVSDLDLAVLTRMSGDAPWAINYGLTPIFCLSFADGYKQGQGYMDVSGVCPISGNNKVREVFRVSGADRTVAELRVRLRKKGAPGDLTVRLETAEGARVAGGVVPAASVMDSYSWVVCKFATACVLKTGQSYHLELSAPPGDAYETVPLQEGGARCGFDCPEVFADGYFQFTTGSAWEGPREKTRKDLDMQFYFSR